jgi:type II restriction/modification system DNA methylase subunit YeeA
MRRNGFDVSRQPILRALDTIECRDALLNPDGREAAWPVAEFIVGNPPFLGNKRMIAVLGEAYTTQLRQIYAGRVPGGADLVMFWFEKARAALAAGMSQRVGLVATNSIRGGDNRQVLTQISGQATLVEAWADEPWVVDGAAVRVSLVCFARESTEPRCLNGQPVLEIYPDLTGRDAQAGVDLTQAKRLAANAGYAFQGPVKVGPFDIPGDQARAFLQMPLNPNGRSNAEVVKPWANGMDIVRRPSDTWIIDFGEMSAAEASLYEAPFDYVYRHVKPLRDQNRDRQRREHWWQLGRSGGDLRRATAGLSRVIITPRVAKHRLFVWRAAVVIPDSRLVVIARDDETTFGVLHSRIHELWSLRTCSWHGDGDEGGRPTYNAHSCFETFPFPEGFTPADKGPIAEAARRLNELRENWLNPTDLVHRVPEVAPGYPDRLLPIDERAAALLKTRTLTNLYNEKPTWLINAHRELDEAVAAAYHWPVDLVEDELLRRLLALNQEQSG